jgi:hypothetical protein
MITKGADDRFLKTLNGTPVYLGTIVSTTTKNNHDTASAFNNTGVALKNMTLLVQSDAAAYIRAGTANSVTVTSANGLLLEANEKYVLKMTGDYSFLAALSVSGSTANIKVFQLI